MDLVEFLTARLDEDERVAREASPGDGDAALLVLDDDYRHDRILISPTRVLADVAAKRAILDEHPRAPVSDGCHTCMTQWACATLRALASVFADHPDFDPAWKVLT